jgi:hypothetical protein
MADRLTIVELAGEAKLKIDQDSLLTQENRTRAKTWLVQTLKDANATDIDKRRTLANYVLSGKIVD